jgi:hypothetical protein
MDTMEFRSPVNAWKPQTQYVSDVSKVRFLEVDVSVGSVLYIPPYWWYTIRYSADTETGVASFTYNTVMNVVANLSDWSTHFLQHNNITRKIAAPLVSSPSQHLGLDSIQTTASAVESDPVVDTATKSPETTVQIPLSENTQIITNAGIYTI